MFRNVVSAVLLDAEFYNEVADEPGLISQATAVVVVANLLGGVGAALAIGSNVIAGAAIGVATGLVGWLVWSGVAFAVGVLVFAYAPLAIGIIPWLGFVGAAWALFAAVIAIRESMEFSTGRSIVTTAFGWSAWLGLAVLLNALLGWDFLAAWSMNPGS